MSVLMTLRVRANPRSVEAEDKSLMMSLVERAKDHGIISHHIYGTDDEVLVIDEWPDEASFQAFFAASPEIPGIIGRAGGEAPDVTLWRHLDVGDDIG